MSAASAGATAAPLFAGSLCGLLQSGQALRVIEHVAEEISLLGEARQDGADGERVRPQGGVVELVPVDGCGDRGAGRRSGAVGGDEGLVDRVLRVVEPGEAA